AFNDESADAFARALLGGKVDCRRRAFAAAVDDLQPERLADVAVAMADEDELLALRLESDRRALLPIRKQSHPADRGGRENGEARPILILGFVVEADVAAHDRKIERAAGFGHTFDTAHELAHDFGPLRVTEVQAVGDGQRLCSDRAEIA